MITRSNATSIVAWRRRFAIARNEPVPQTIFPVNTLLNFEFDSPGDPITASDLNANQIGDQWTWSETLATPRQTTIVAGNSPMRASVSINGATYDGAGTRSLQFNLASDDTGYEIFNGTPPGTYSKLTIGAVMTFSAGSATANALDYFNIAGGSYVVLQHNIPGVQGGTAGELHLETQISGVTYKGIPIPVDNGVKYQCYLNYNGTDGTVEIVVLDYLTGELIGSGKSTSDVLGQTVAYVNIQNYLFFDGGTTTIDNVVIATAGNAAMPLEQFTTPDPTSVAVEQQLSGRLEVTWESVCMSYKIERFNLGSWTTIEANILTKDLSNIAVGSNVYTDSTVVNGQSYKYRITAFVDTLSSSAVESNTVVVDNAAAPIAMDSFNYTNLTSLTAPNWAVGNGFVTCYNPLGTGGGAYGGNSQPYAVSTASYNQDHRSEVTISVIGASFEFISVGVRGSTVADTRYWVQVDGSQYYLVSRVAGSQTVLSNASLALVAGNKIALQAVGLGAATRLTFQVDTGSGWTSIVSNLDPGVYINGGGALVGGDGGSFTTSLFDSFKGYNL